MYGTEPSLLQHIKLKHNKEFKKFDNNLKKMYAAYGKKVDENWFWGWVLDFICLIRSIFKFDFHQFLRFLNERFKSFPYYLIWFRWSSLRLSCWHWFRSGRLPSPIIIVVRGNFPPLWMESASKLSTTSRDANNIRPKASAPNAHPPTILGQMGCVSTQGFTMNLTIW